MIIKHRIFLWYQVPPAKRCTVFPLVIGELRKDKVQVFHLVTVLWVPFSALTFFCSVKGGSSTPCCRNCYRWVSTFYVHCLCSDALVTQFTLLLIHSVGQGDTHVILIETFVCITGSAAAVLLYYWWARSKPSNGASLWIKVCLLCSIFVTFVPLAGPDSKNRFSLFHAGHCTRWANMASFLRLFCVIVTAFSALTLLVGRQEGIWPVKTEWWGTGLVICLQWGTNDLHMVQLMPLPPHYLLLH